MTLPKIDLTSLEYSDIYNQIVDYIKSQSDFSDFNFEGSALSTIVDLLAYNTFYQIIFQNIMINEMFIDSSQKIESLISHAKLQGYTVPSKQSSFATLRLRNAGDNGSSIAAYSKLEGKKSNGDTKLFYNTDSTYLEEEENTGIVQSIFTVYEAKNAVVAQQLTPDITKQSAFIAESNVDIKTLKVEVDLDGHGVYRAYTMSSSIEPNIGVLEKMFFLERRVTGYDILFGGFMDPHSGEYITGPLTNSSRIRVSYLVPSGIEGDGYSNFSFVRRPGASGGGTPITISNSTDIVSISGVSKNGQDDPDLETLRFFIPRYFASQDRAITKTDMVALLIQGGYAQTASNIKHITGGDELQPQQLGKVWFQLEQVSSTDPIAESARQLLQSKATVGIEIKYGVAGS